MTSMGWEIVRTVTTVIGIYVAGRMYSDKKGNSFLILALSGFLLSIQITATYQQGLGHIADTERLRSNEAYEVVEVIESPGRPAILIVENYKGILFAIGLTASDVPIAKENRLVSVDKDHNGSRIVPFPRPKEFRSGE